MYESYESEGTVRTSARRCHTGFPRQHEHPANWPVTLKLVPSAENNKQAVTPSRLVSLLHIQGDQPKPTSLYSVATTAGASQQFLPVWKMYYKCCVQLMFHPVAYRTVYTVFWCATCMNGLLNYEWQYHTRQSETL